MKIRKVHPEVSDGFRKCFVSGTIRGDPFEFCIALYIGERYETFSPYKEYNRGLVVDTIRRTDSSIKSSDIQ